MTEQELAQILANNPDIQTPSQPNILNTVDTHTYDTRTYDTRTYTERTNDRISLLEARITTLEHIVTQLMKSPP